MKRWMLIAVLLGSAAAAGAAPIDEAFQASVRAELSSDISAAIQSLEKLGPAATADYLVQVRLGWLHYLAKQWKDSQEHYRKAAQLAPQSLEAPLGLMLAQMAGEQNDDALRTGQSILARDPNHYTALSRTAWIYYLKGDFRRAITLYRKLTAQYPCDTEMLLGLGYTLKLSGDIRGAAECFRRVLLLNPDNERAKKGLDPSAP